MASVLLRDTAGARLGRYLRNTRITERLGDERHIVTSRVRLKKVMEPWKNNPYYENYAEKIAKVMQINPEKFLRVEQQNQALEKKGAYNLQLYNVIVVTTLFVDIGSIKRFASIVAIDDVAYMRYPGNNIDDVLLPEHWQTIVNNSEELVNN